MKNFRPIVVCAIALLIAGCQGGIGINPSIWEAKHLEKDDAIIVHGVKAVGAKYKEMVVVWQRIIENKDKLNTDKLFDLEFYNLANDNIFNKTIGSTQYGVTKVKAGKYVLTAIRVTKAFDSSELFGKLGPFLNVAGAFYKGSPGKSGLFEYVFKGHVSRKMKYTLAFTVNPGEVIYIGDHFVNASTFPLRSIRIVDNFKSAQAVPKLHPSLRPRLKFRMPRELATFD